MTDHVSKEKRSQMMAAVRGKHTQPELAIRKLLHNAGYRFRLHDSKLPGKPDIVLAKYRAAIFINGCFWHGHRCLLSKRLPETQKAFWNEKIAKNRDRDLANMGKLISQGWRVCTIWECAIKRQHRLPINQMILKLDEWLRSDTTKSDISGEKNDTIEKC